MGISFGGNKYWWIRERQTFGGNLFLRLLNRMQIKDAILDTNIMTVNKILGAYRLDGVGKSKHNIIYYTN